MAVKGIKFNRMETGEEQDVDYEMTDTNGFFSTHANAIPMPSAVQGPRIFYGSRFFEQALPLVNNEAPWVRNMNNSTGRSFDFTLGESMGARRAKVNGLVESVSPDEIVLRTPEGKRESVDLYNLFPGNRKSLQHNTPSVKVGQPVAAGDLLAKSNFTDDEGRMALGRNARVGLLAYKGHSMDDALVISQAFARKMLSDHAETIEQDKDETLTSGLDHYVSLFPKKFKTDQLTNIGPDGVIKVGAMLQPGDPVMLQTRPRSFSSESQGVGRLSRSMRFVRKDAAKVWDGSDPAEVLDVARTRDGGVKVLVRYQSPTRPGDKLCYAEGTEVLTMAGWKDFKDVTLEDTFYTISPEGSLETTEATALHVYPYEGRMYTLQTTQVDLCVTPDHNLYARNARKPGTPYLLSRAEDLFGKRYRLKNNAEENLLGSSPPSFVFSASEKRDKRGGRQGCRPQEITVPSGPFMEFLGLYISEGNLGGCQEAGWNVQITQFTNVEYVKSVLARCGFAYDHYKPTGKFRIYSRALHEVLAPIGRCHEKYIPEFCWSLSRALLEGLYEGLMAGDGCRTGTCHSYSSVSYRLVDDVQRLCLLTGRAARVERITDGGPVVILGRNCMSRPVYAAYIYKNKNHPTINHGHVHTQGGQSETWETYSGNVFCVTLATRGVLYVRRNGRAVWCGNCIRAGQKTTVSKILPDDHMPRTADGQPLEVLLNPLGLPSRENASSFYEMLLGKIAAKTGKAYTLPAFLPEGQTWHQFVEDELAKNGMTDAERVFDPKDDQWLDNPVTVGNSYILKLHHQAEKKMSARGQSGYTVDAQPQRGGGAGGGAQRMSGLEMNVLQSSGARGVQKEAILLRGEKNDDYWRQVRANRSTPELDKPFVWHKFLALLNGTGIQAKDLGHGRLRLAPMTDSILAGHGSLKIKNDGIVDLQTMEPKPGGLFDPVMVRENKWGHIDLPFPVVNPSYEETVRQLLGLTEKEYQAVLDAPEKIPESV